MGADRRAAEVRVPDRLAAARGPRLHQPLRRGAARRRLLRRRRADEGERDGARVRAAHPLAVALPARGPPARGRGQARRRQLARLRGRGGVLPHRRVQDPPRPDHVLAARADAGADVQERAEARGGAGARAAQPGAAARAPQEAARRGAAAQEVPRARAPQGGGGQGRAQGAQRLGLRRPPRRQKQNQNQGGRLRGYVGIVAALATAGVSDMYVALRLVPLTRMLSSRSVERLN